MSKLIVYQRPNLTKIDLKLILMLLLVFWLGFGVGFCYDRLKVMMTLHFLWGIIIGFLFNVALLFYFHHHVRYWLVIQKENNHEKL